MLAQEVAASYPGKVRFVSENFGASALAEKFGVTRYPAVFINDVLVARPCDFGFFGEGEDSGRYTPWRNADNQAKFKADLKRMIDLVLAGKQAALSRERAATKATAAPGQVAAFPQVSLTDLSGRPLKSDQLAGRIVLVEFWATWCPPCRSTLEWLGALRRKYGENVAVLALVVESPENEVRATVVQLSPEIHWAISDAKTAQAFGDVVAVPTLLIFGRSGKTVRVLYGAPPDLHEQAEKTLDSLLQEAEHAQR